MTAPDAQRPAQCGRSQADHPRSHGRSPRPVRRVARGSRNRGRPLGCGDRNPVRDQVNRGRTRGVKKVQEAAANNTQWTPKVALRVGGVPVHPPEHLVRGLQVADVPATVAAVYEVPVPELVKRRSRKAERHGSSPFPAQQIPTQDRIHEAIAARYASALRAKGTASATRRSAPARQYRR